MIGGGGLITVEPFPQVSYLSVFIAHFLVSPTENLEILRKFYLEHRLSTLQIEEITDSAWTKPTLIEALKQHQISRDRLPSRLKYGEKLVGGKRVPHKEEQKIIQQIMALRNKEMSLRAIAKYLNDKNIPSKLGSKWNKTTVAEIINREQKTEV